jgi:hypothetical protein
MQRPPLPDDSKLPRPHRMWNKSPVTGPD